MSLNDYRLSAEQEYCNAMVRMLRNGYQELQVEHLLRTGLSNSRREALDQQAKRLGLETIDTFRVEFEVCHRLLYYLKQVYHVRQQNIQLVRQAILEHERVRLGLSDRSAEAINAVLLSDAKKPAAGSDPAKLATYDQHLAQALRNTKTLPLLTVAELGLLKNLLGLSDSEVPPWQKLTSENGVNYIPLWRLLKAQKWQEANEETIRCLRQSAKQQGRDYESLDVAHLPNHDLRIVDRLWREFSRDRFGFSIQNQLWRTVAPNLEKFGKLVDWRRNRTWIGYEYVDFSLDAVKGHLPVFPFMGWWCWSGGMTALLDRIGQIEAVEPVDRPIPIDQAPAKKAG